MILTKEVMVPICSYYINKNFKIIQNEIIIPIELLPKNSAQLILVKCDICGLEKNLSMRKYNKNISSNNIYACSNKCAVLKGELTCMKNNGTKYPLQNEEIKNNLKLYFINKYGVENISQLKETKEKYAEVMIEKYGFKTNLLSAEIHQKAIESSKSIYSILKRKNTMLNNYGVDNPRKSDGIYEKIKNTNIIKYGVEYPAQNKEIFDKTQMASYKIKYYKGIRYQGTYELDFIKKCEELNILNDLTKVKSITYQFENKNKFYHPDFYLKKLNLIIEIKSNYYYELYLNKNLAKEKSCLEQKYNFIFIVDKKYEEFFKIIKNYDDKQRNNS